MWVCAIFGMATHFAEIALGIYYRNYEKDKGYSGGPMYYLENGVGKQMKLGALGKILAIAITLFAFTTILGWSYYGSQTIGYLFGKISTYIYKIFYILFIVVGSVMSLNLVWNITDTFNALMAFPNLIGLVLLSGTVLKIVKNYYDRKSGKKVKPMVSYK